MAKNKQKDKVPPGAAEQGADAGPPPQMKRKEYEAHMRILHGELGDALAARGGPGMTGAGEAAGSEQVQVGGPLQGLRA